jgi:hypothetical protein
MTDNPEALPCPFCGADGIIYEWDETSSGELVAGHSLRYQNTRHLCRPQCSSCDCRLENGWYRIEDAIEEWNRRAHAPKQEPVDLVKYIPNRLVAEAAVKTISDIDVLNSFLTALNLARDTKQEPSVSLSKLKKAWENRSNGSEFMCAVGNLIVAAENRQAIMSKSVQRRIAAQTKEK